MKKKLIFIILIILSVPNTFADAVSDVIEIQKPSTYTGTLPATYQEKGFVGSLLSTIFDSSGKIQNNYTIGLTNIHGLYSNTIPKWNGQSFIEGHMSYSGSALELAGDINVLGNIYQSGSLFAGGGGGKFISGLTPDSAVYMSGSIGIGVNDPSAIAGLEVTRLGYEDRGHSYMGSAYIGMGFKRTVDGAAGIEFQTDASQNTTATATIYKGSGDLGNMLIQNITGGDIKLLTRNGGWNTLVIKENGRVGIGINDPDEKFEVMSRADRGRASIGSSYVTLGSKRTVNGAAGIQFITDASQGTTITAEIYKGSGVNGNMIIRNGGGGDVKIQTKYGWNNIVIKENGRVGIGTNSPTAKLSVNGTANKPGGGSWGTFSDARLKDISGDYNKGLSEILQLTPKKFHYKVNNSLGWNSEKEYIGFIAQDVQTIFPEAVTTSSNGYLELDPQAINVALINAIKEQQQQIEELKKLITQ